MSTNNSQGQRALYCPASASLKQENIAAEKSFFFQSSPSFLRFAPQMAWLGLSKVLMPQFLPTTSCRERDSNSCLHEILLSKYGVYHCATTAAPQTHYEITISAEHCGPEC